MHLHPHILQKKGPAFVTQKVTESQRTDGVTASSGLPGSSPLGLKRLLQNPTHPAGRQKKGGGAATKSQGKTASNFTEAVRQLTDTSLIWFLSLRTRIEMKFLSAKICAHILATDLILVSLSSRDCSFSSVKRNPFGATTDLPWNLFVLGACYPMWSFYQHPLLDEVSEYIYFHLFHILFLGRARL